MNAMADDDFDGRRPGDSDMHRRQRGKNMFMFWMLLAMAAVFFALTLVRLRGHL